MEPTLVDLPKQKDYSNAMVSEQEIEKIASLARLSLTSEEKTAFAKQISSVLNHFQELAMVNTEGVEPLVTPTDIEPYWREDKVIPGMGSEKAVAGAPEKVGNLFKVPPVVGS
jgi:aspartyl-tRNA(Asn)/glutamyl-tRNA(Gln) amidotransferase subunit C